MRFVHERYRVGEKKVQSSLLHLLWTHVLKWSFAIKINIIWIKENCAHADEKLAYNHEEKCECGSEGLLKKKKEYGLT